VCIKRVLVTATIARWIKSVLQYAGTDTSICTAQRVRRAAFTHTCVTGVLVSQIFKMADWSSEHTFGLYFTFFFGGGRGMVRNFCLIFD